MSFLEGRKDLHEVDVANDWRLILTKKEIKSKVKKLAANINEQFEGKNVVVVCILKGAVYFFTDLTRQLTIPHSTYFIEASSYRDAQTQQEVEVCSLINPSKFQGKEVIIIDELFDNGNTMKMVVKKISEEGKIYIGQIFTCTLFKKNKGATENAFSLPDLYGFSVPDVWLVGYGLNDRQEKRNWTHLYACPKSGEVSKSEDDRIFEDEEYYQKIRTQLTI